MNRSDDSRFMRRCIELARRGSGRVEPNPAVGCVVVREGTVVGEGWHEEFGKAHAEVNALRQAGEAARGATLYASLEPCSEYGKTPPCTDAIIKAGIKQVIFGASDSTQRGEQRLREAGVQVRGGILADDCRMLNPYFFHLPCGDRPFVMAKWAMSVDGRIRTGPGAPKWISCQESRLLAHRWRSTVDAVCVGIGTVLADDPLLTCRVGLPSPKRVVFDSSARTPLASQLVRSAEATAPVLIVTATRPRSTAELDRLRSLEAAGCTILTAKSSDEGIDLPDALRLLHSECAIHTIMVEGGGRLLASVLRAGLVDETRVFVAPVALGCDPANAAPPPDAWASDAIARFLQTQDLLCHRCGSDLLLIARRRMQA